MINIEEDIKAQTQETEAQQEPETAEAAEAPEENKEEASEKAEETGTEEAAEEAGTEEAKPEDAKPEDAKPEKAEPEEDENSRYLRLMAEFQNYKKRVAKEKQDLYSYANEKIVTELLAVVDNFERALQQEAGDEGFKEGMELIFKQLGDVLEKSGLKEIEALGEDFDPNLHNAVMTEESEEYESGKVSGVLQKGYTLNGKVIRASMVKVVG